MTLSVASMYEGFGAHEVGNTGKVQFQLFFPDSAFDPKQYAGVADPQIARVQVAGTFQGALGGTDWDFATRPCSLSRRTPRGASTSGNHKGWHLASTNTNTG